MEDVGEEFGVFDHLPQLLFCLIDELALHSLEQVKN